MPIAKTASDLGQIIRARRKELNLDQAQLARRVGVSRQWLIDIEKGKPGAELGLVLRTLNALDLSMHLNPTPTPEGRALDLDHRPEKRTSAPVDIGEIVERNTAGFDGLYGNEVSRALQTQDSILSLVKQLSADIPDDLKALVREYASATELARQLNLVREHTSATELAKQLDLLREHTSATELAKQLDLLRKHTSATELAKQHGKVTYDPQDIIRQHDSATELAKQLGALDPLGGFRRKDPS